MWLLVLKFLKDNWKIVAVAGAVLLLVSYIAFLRWDVKRYKIKYENAVAELAAASSREKQLEAANAGLTRLYQERSADLNAVIERNAELGIEGIRKDEELANIRISLNAARLFNQSKRDPSTPIAKAKQGDVGKADSPQAPAYSTGISFPLREVFILVAENDKNHWKCVKQVELWQGFWSDYEQAVNQSLRVTK